MERIRQYFERLMPLDDTSWKQMEGCFKNESFEKGEVVLEDGKTCDFVAFVQTGIFRFYYLKEGNEKVTAFFFSGDFLSNYRSYLTGAPSTHYIECLSAGTIWKLKKTDLDALYATNPQIQKLGRLIAEGLYLMVASRLDSFLYETPEERYLALIRKGSRLIQDIPQYMLASYLGVSAESLSRIRKRIAL